MDYYGYGYGYGDEAIMEEVMTAFGFTFLGILAVILLVVLAVSLAMYIFRSLGLYAIANRRGIRNAWLSWIPVGYTWILGSISDQYQYVVKGKVTNRRKILLILSLCAGVISGTLNGVSTAMMITGSEEAAFATGALGIIAALVGSGLSIATVVFYYMSMYDLYTSVSPKNNVLFLVLSIIFRVTEPFFVFFNRNSDEGMPPRREEPQTYIPEPDTAFWETTEE